LGNLEDKLITRLLFITYGMDGPKIETHIIQFSTKDSTEERNPLEDLDVDGII
jgi:hypothetical protein